MLKESIRPHLYSSEPHAFSFSEEDVERYHSLCDALDSENSSVNESPSTPEERSTPEVSEQTLPEVQTFFEQNANLKTDKTDSSIVTD